MSSNSIFSSALFFTGSSIVARFGGLITQFVLGWLLSKEDYGVFAMALSISAVVSCVRNGGTDQVIIQRGKEYDDFAPRVATFSVIFNIFACIVVLGISGWLAEYYKNDSLQTLLIILAVGYLLATPAPILIAQLSIQKKFRSIAIINLITVLLKHSLTIMLAVFGFGVFSLVVALAAQPLIGAIISLFFVKQWRGFAKIRDLQFLDVFRSSVWVIASNFSFQIAINIQYFLLGAYFSSTSIGIYFFAVQLVNSPIALINNTVKGVVFPSLSNISDNNIKYQAAVFKSIVVAYTLGIQLSILGYFFIPVLADTLWNEIWNDSNIYIKLMCLMIPSIILTNTIVEILASAGLWKNRFIMLIISTLIEVVAIKISIGGGVLFTVILSLLVFRSGLLVLLAMYTVKKICGREYLVRLISLLLPYSILLGMLVFTMLMEGIVFAQIVKLFMVIVLFYYYVYMNRYLNINSKIAFFIKRKIAYNTKK